MKLYILLIFHTEQYNFYGVFFNYKLCTYKMFISLFLKNSSDNHKTVHCTKIHTMLSCLKISTSPSPITY